MPLRYPTVSQAGRITVTVLVVAINSILGLYFLVSIAAELYKAAWVVAVRSQPNVNPDELLVTLLARRLGSKVGCNRLRTCTVLCAARCPLHARPNAWHGFWPSHNLGVFFPVFSQMANAVVSLTKAKARLDRAMSGAWSAPLSPRGGPASPSSITTSALGRIFSGRGTGGRSGRSMSSRL